MGSASRPRLPIPPWTQGDEENWQPLQEGRVSHAPDAFGVCEIANSAKSCILIVHGVVREELRRILRDPRAIRHDAHFFRCRVTLTPGQAQELAERLVRAYEKAGRSKPRTGDF